MASHKRRRPTDPVGLLSGVCLLLAFLLAVQVGWQYWGAGLDVTLVAERTQGVRRIPTIAETTGADTLAWRSDPPPDEPEPVGDDLWGYMYLPSLDRAWERPIWEGVDADTLAALGAGHYPSTPMPGAVGNSAYAGHDTPTGFGMTYRLEAGDPVLIRTADHWYRYEVTGSRILDASDTWVLDADAPRAERGMTLTTCWPMFTPVDTGQRHVTWARWDGWADTADGTPPELADTALTTVERLERVATETARRAALPVTGVMAGAFALMWLIADLAAWLLWRRRTLASWSRVSWNPLVWLWRIQAGPCGEGRVRTVLAVLIRIMLLSLLLAAVVCACWRWTCPMLADLLPGVFATPHPTLRDA